MRIHDMTAGLIGREHPAALLRAEAERAAESHGGLVLVTGEAGIGKTTLVTSAADEARRLGALVLGGSCWDSDSAPGYWPWVQVLRGLRRGATPAEWAAAEEVGGGSLAALLGEASSAEAVDGFPLYDAVTSALVSVSQSRPVMVVLDDLHWSDVASLKLLRFAAQHTWFERLLLVGTYRDVEVEAADHPLRPLLPPLVAKATTISLTGLDRDDVGALMARTAGDEPSADLVAEVHRRTGGNPFFVEQTARLWRSGGSVTAIAPGVRDTLLRRLSLLPKPVVEILTAASVLGREFHRQVLAALAAAPVPHVDRLLDQAMAARLVAAKGGGVFAFAHDLVRETLYDSLDDAKRPRWHAGVVRALDASAELGGRLLPADLARHAHLAGEHLDPQVVVKHLLAAARDAGRRLATEEAIGHYRRALAATPADAPRRRVEVALRLAHELHVWADRVDGRRIFGEAVAIARQLDDPRLLARVALSIHRTYDEHLGPAGTEVLVEAHARLVGGDAPTEGLLARDRLAQDLAIHLAVQARSEDDDEALAFGLWARHDTIWGPGTASERVALTEELLAVARRGGEVEMETIAAALRWVALLELGDPRYLDQFRDYIVLGERSGVPRVGLSLVIDRSILAGLMGRFEEAEHLVEEVLTHGQVHGHEHLEFMIDHHRWALRLMQGRFDELDAVHLELRRTRHPCPDLLVAIAELRMGNLDAALRHLAEVTAAGKPGDRSIQPLWLCFQAEAAAASRDPRLCEIARAELLPHSGEWAVSLYGWDIRGPVVLWLAVLDAAQERWDEAVAGFTAAWHSADLLRARPWSLEARARLAEALLARGGPGDAQEASRLLEAAEPEAAELGMRSLLAQIRRTRHLHASPTLPVPGDPQRPASRDPVLPAARGLAVPPPLELPHAASGDLSVPASPGPALPAAGDVAASPELGFLAAGDLAVPATSAPSHPASGEVAVPVSPGLPSPGRTPGPVTLPKITHVPAVDGPGADGSASRGGGAINEFRRDGAVWSLGFGGRTVHLPDAKGLRDLHILLSLPGSDVPAVRLLDPRGGEVVVAARRMGGDPVLDDEAKARYRAHLSRLDEEIDRAAEQGDDRRAAEFDREREALLAELRSASGLGGRDRRLGDEAERARKTVTARIRDILRKLDTLHPALAAHLRATVSTGATCRYQPPDKTSWRL
ncbi:AAA family ATPase [Sphaerisporangium sp. TRM90804]|uniref:ATP-binding protein n=1 Tax=Sphaerisporangium sp. TRM90804 TaxID=3031113 RepID=UPI00244B859D|nr:AAA family ATPase [Sphaerisporangium sp. TRM90804]MDH2429659.1 AAA family ATPase [Sphaerisporangium sp. TRM90804]